MENFIYNQAENLRFDLDEKLCSATRLPDGQWFVIIQCEDKCTGNWNKTKFYCGLISDIYNEKVFMNGVLQIMQTGSEPYELMFWIDENMIKPLKERAA